MSTDSLNTIEGERSIPSVNSRSTARWKRGAVSLAVAASLVTAGTIYIKYVSAEPVAEVEIKRDLTTVSTVPTRTFTALPPPESKPKPEPAIELPIAAAVPVALPAPVQRPQRTATPPTPRIDKSASRSAVSVDSQPINNTQVALADNASPGLTGGFGAGGTSGINNLGQSIDTTSTTASRLKNLDYMLTRGAFIDCSLTTRLDSTLPGMSSCTVTRDVYSTNGSSVLIEAGSHVTGEYSADLAQGSQRLYVLWTRVQTPTGVVVNLDSPATDSLGASGVSGYVNTHFWQRFGGAMMLSFIDDAAQIAVNKSSKGDTQIVLGSAGNIASDLASEVLRNTINIPPTLNAHHGARVGIYVARDIDFSTIYEQ